jgi:hypothetical protein
VKNPSDEEPVVEVGGPAELVPNKKNPRVTGAMGGAARAKTMTARERKLAAKDAVTARWGVRATHMGKVMLGGHEIPCANLEDGRRVISITALTTALGRSSPGAQTYRRRTEQGLDQLPIFLASKRLSPFIPNDFSVSTIRYTPVGNGSMAEGIDAQSVPMICRIWVDAWTAGALVAHQIPTAHKAAAIATALAHVGITALVDEATGFQYDRDREALALILEQYLGKELAAWTKTFPDDFYRNLSKLRGISYDDQKRPQYFGMLTNDIIYSRLAPGVRKELCTRNPRLDTGRRRHKHHQLLSRDIGHPELKSHLAVATALMRLAPSYDKFIEQLNHVSPRYGDNLHLLSYDEMQPPVAD